MDIEDNCKISVYEVLSENTQKYSSTSISGGGSALGGTGSEVISPISSTTTLHSDQELWLRDLETGKERKFEFLTFNIGVRPGHRLLCAWDQKSGKLEGVTNLDTDEFHVGNGVVSACSRNINAVNSFFVRLTSALVFFSSWASIPFLSVLHLLMMLSVTYKNHGLMTDAGGENKKKYFGLLMLIDAGLFLWAIDISNGSRVSLDDWIPYVVGSFVVFSVIHMVILKDEFNNLKKILKSHRASLEKVHLQKQNLLCGRDTISA